MTGVLPAHLWVALGVGCTWIPLYLRLWACRQWGRPWMTRSCSQSERCRTVASGCPLRRWGRLSWKCGQQYIFGSRSRHPCSLMRSSFEGHGCRRPNLHRRTQRRWSSRKCHRNLTWRTTPHNSSGPHKILSIATRSSTARCMWSWADYRNCPGLQTRHRRAGYHHLLLARHKVRIPTRAEHFRCQSTSTLIRDSFIKFLLYLPCVYSFKYHWPW